MLSIFQKKKARGEVTTLKVEGMHCSSCVMNIDGVLEDMEGVYDASTSYKKSNVKVDYDSKKVSIKQLTKIIESAGYQVIS